MGRLPANPSRSLFPHPSFKVQLSAHLDGNPRLYIDTTKVFELQQIPSSSLSTPPNTLFLQLGQNPIYSALSLKTCTSTLSDLAGCSPSPSAMDSFRAFDPESNDAASSLSKRQQGILALPTTYLGLNSGPSPGILVAIVLGSVVGFLLVLWLVTLCFFWGAGPFAVFRRQTTVVTEKVTHGHRRPSSRRRFEEVEIVEEHVSRRGSRRERTRGDVEVEVRVSYSAMQ